MNTFYRVTSACVLAASGVAASAAMVHVQFDNPIFSGVAAPEYDLVTLTYPTQAGGARTSTTTAAGRFQGTASNLRGVDASIFVDGLDDLYMYCYDLYEPVAGGWAVDYTINFNGVVARTLDFLGAVNLVLSQGKASVDPYAWLHPSNGLMGAAIQLGIWESKYDRGWDIRSGNFSATNVEVQTAGYLSSFIDAIPRAPALAARYVMTLENAGAQDMITGDPPAEVPEPGTLVLAGVGVVALLVWINRRRARAAAADPESGGA